MRELDRGSKQNLTAPVHPTTPILYMVVDVAPSLDSEASEAIVFLRCWAGFALFGEVRRHWNPNS